MTDVCSGKMNLKQLIREIERVILTNIPEKVVITIEKDEEIKGYKSIIYIPINDFQKLYNGA